MQNKVYNLRKSAKDISLEVNKNFFSINTRDTDYDACEMTTELAVKT